MNRKRADVFSIKNPLPLLLAGLLAVVVGCSSPNDEAGAMIGKQAAVMENYVDGIESARNADDMVKAMARYTDEMKELLPKLREFEKKYTLSQSEAIARDHEKEMTRIENAAARLPGAMMKTAGYMMDEKVQAAMAEMAAELGEDK